MSKDATQKPSPNRARLVGPVLFLALGAGVEGLLLGYQQERATERQAENALQGEKIRARLEAELHLATLPSNSLAGYWAARRDFPDQAETRALLADAYRLSRHARSFALAPGYRVAQVFPQDGDGPAAGSDYREQARQWPAIRRSVESRSPVLAGPVPPALGLAYWMPVFTDGQLQGLLGTLIDGPSLFSAAGLGQAEYRYALRAQNGPGGSEETVMGEGALFADPVAAIARIAVPGGNWSLAVKSTAEPSAWPGIFRALGWLFAGLFAAQSAYLLKLRSQISDLALYDRLTGLPGRHLFIDRLKQAIRRTKRNGGSLSVLFVNLNQFKSVNSAHGEKVGDMMLAGIGKRLSGSIRHCDTVTRWGGDEFLVLLDACPPDQARPIAESLRHKIELPVAYGGRELRIGAAIGVASYPEDGRSLAALLKAANSRMLEDKSHRKTPSRPPSPAETSGGADERPPA